MLKLLFFTFTIILIGFLIFFYSFLQYLAFLIALHEVENFYNILSENWDSGNSKRILENFSEKIELSICGNDGTYEQMKKWIETGKIDFKKGKIEKVVKFKGNLTFSIIKSSGAQHYTIEKFEDRYRIVRMHQIQCQDDFFIQK